MLADKLQIGALSVVLPLLNLPDELLDEVLTWLDQPLYDEKLERRAYLSQESFSLPASPSRDCAKDTASVRGTCKRLAEVGAVHQFARISIRFSQRGLDRLEQLSHWPHLAKNVMKFSYLVRNFYVEGPERVASMPADLEMNVGVVHLKALSTRLREQESILKSNRDIKVLCKALLVFRNLQHVQVLRVQDRGDDVLLEQLRQHHELSRFFDLCWTQACVHSTSTVGKAIMMSQSPCSRFSSPMLSPQSVQVLAAPLADYVPLASRLTSLEIHFDDVPDLDDRVLSISEAIRVIFKAAVNMQAIHIGFPSHRPVRLRLEDVFHFVRWNQLKAFGIQSWRLEADEIINFARRHKDRLRGLRLRDVQLKQGSMWTDVLRVLRDEMLCLEWVSLRRIGYAVHFDEQLSLAGAEVPDDEADVGSESDVSTDDNSIMVDAPSTSYIDYDSDDYSVETSDERLEHETYWSDGDDSGPQAHEMDFPDIPLTDRAKVVGCSCDFLGLYPSSPCDLGDDGIFINNNLRKLWEKWVVRRCSTHGTLCNDP